MKELCDAILIHLLSLVLEEYLDLASIVGAATLNCDWVFHDEATDAAHEKVGLDQATLGW